MDSKLDRPAAGLEEEAYDDRPLQPDEVWYVSRRYLEQVNKKLLTKFMLDNEPFIALPAPYFPAQNIPHFPPVFTFGPIYSSQELIKFGKAINAFGNDSPIDTDWAWRVAARLNEIFELPEHQHIKVDFSYTAVARGSTGWSERSFLIELQTSYDERMPRDKLNKIISYFKVHQKKTPMWWISDKNKKLEEDYGLRGGNILLHDDDED